MRSEGVQGVLTLFCGGVTQTCHDDRVVKLKELGTEEDDGEGQERQVEEEGRDRVKDSELEPCGVRCHHQVWNSTRYLQIQRMMCTTQSSKSTSSLVVHCELLVVSVVPVVVCDDAAVRHTLVLIAFTVGFVVVVHFA